MDHFILIRKVCWKYECCTLALYDKDVREKMIEKGKLMFEKFSWEKCRKETMEVYKSVLSQG